MVKMAGLFGEAVEEYKAKKKTRSVTKKKKVDHWGCANCSLNPHPGLDQPPKKSVFEKFVPDKPIWILAMNPAKNEILEQKNLVGRAGKLFWRRVEKLGNLFTRASCNVDNIVRCRNVEKTSYGVKEAPPDKIALKCCHKYTQERYERAKPKVVLLLGSMAQKQFLGKQLQKSKTVYWDEQLQCKVICCYHPSYFLRGGASKASWKAFDTSLREVKFALDYPGQYGYVETLDYKILGKPLSVKKLFRKLKKEKRTVGVDFEWGVVDNQVVILCMAVSNKAGWSRIIFFDHPMIKRNPLVTKRLKSLTCQFLADASIKKVMWHGVSDATTSEALWGVETQGYDLDGEFIEYFAYPNRKNYQLETATDLRIKKMTGYKDIVNPYVQKEKNFALVPPKALKIRCCGDADATRRLAMSKIKEVNPELVKMYVQASFPLDQMGERGILFDKEHCNRLRKIYKPLSTRIDQRIKMIAGDPDFNPTDENLKKLFVTKLGVKLTALTNGAKKKCKDRLGRDFYGATRLEIKKLLKEFYGEKWWKGYSLQKEDLQDLYDDYEIAKLILQKRFIDKLDSTYLTGFEESAESNNGYCRTRFKMTVASSGRLASGGDKKGKNTEEGTKKVNLQNIHGDPNAQNILISTPKWWEIQNAWHNRNSGDVE